MKKLLVLAISIVACFAQPGLHAEDSAKNEAATLQKAIFAGGCFWCMQEPFDHLKGVVSTVVGYTGGAEDHPTYDQVSAGKTGHKESIEVTFDPARITYDQMLDAFWRNINPTQPDGQFYDIGRQYQTAIYYLNDEQKKVAEGSKERLAKSRRFDKPIVTSILPATTFWPAEEYHQKYYKKNPRHYEAYHVGSGRPAYLKRVWGGEQNPSQD